MLRFVSACSQRPVPADWTTTMAPRLIEGSATGSSPTSPRLASDVDHSPTPTRVVDVERDYF